MGKMKNAYRILNYKSEGKGHSENLDVEGRTILAWILG
jgi:hypothetical protein